MAANNLRHLTKIYLKQETDLMNAQQEIPQPEKIELYEARKKIFPKRAEGQFRRLKWIIMAVTLSIYYITPWLRWDRGPHAPDQAVLIDIANRRFYAFFIEIWPQEFYFVAGMLVMAGVGLFLVTSVMGRAWCGYTCPQTVWVDLFLVVERFIEGDRNTRVKLHHAKWDARKWRLRLTKWVVWLLIAMATGGAWVFYFADAPTLATALILFTRDRLPLESSSLAIIIVLVLGFHLFPYEVDGVAVEDLGSTHVDVPCVE